MTNALNVGHTESTIVGRYPFVKNRQKFGNGLCSSAISLIELYKGRLKFFATLFSELGLVKPTHCN